MTKFVTSVLCCGLLIILIEKTGLAQVVSIHSTDLMESASNNFAYNASPYPVLQVVIGVKAVEDTRRSWLWRRLTRATINKAEK